MSHTARGTLNSFLPIFYVSKFFGSNLYPLPKTISSTNVNVSLRAIDFLFCLIQFGLHLFVIFPLYDKWQSYDSIFNNEFATEIGSSGLAIIIFIGQGIHYATILTHLFITIMGMKSSTIIRKILLTLDNFDKQVSSNRG